MAGCVETFELNCVNEKKFVSLALFVGVHNVSKLRNELTSGKLEAVLLNTTLVSAHHVLVSFSDCTLDSVSSMTQSASLALGLCV